jgi:DNA gyrase subunit B
MAEGHESGALDAFLHVRKRPGMYFGTTSSALPLLWEVVANALDQVIAGRASTIDVVVHADASVTVADDGPGFSTDDDGGLNWLERQFTTMHTAPTADAHAPRVHLLGGAGVGLGPVSAVCNQIDVTVRSASGAFHQSFSRGNARTTLTKVTDPRAGTGTDVRFRFDDTVMRQARWDTVTIQRRLAELTHLWPGLRCSFSQDRTAFAPSIDLRALLDEVVLDATRDPLHPPLLVEVQDGSTRVRVALQWCLRRKRTSPVPRSESIVAWCNFGLLGGGSHVDAVREGVLAGLGEDLTPANLQALDDVLVAVVDIKLLDPVFEGSRRDRLANREIVPLLRAAIATRLEAMAAAEPERHVELRRLIDP